MDIPELKAFVAIAECNSFSKAAAAVHISQPAISRRIQALENRLKQQLFDRDGQKIHLTSAGQILLPKAREILELTAVTETHIRSLGDSIQGPLHLAISHHFAEYYLHDILTQFIQHCPKVELTFEFVASEYGCHQVSMGLADLALITLPQELTHQHLEFTPLQQETLSLVANTLHPLTHGPLDVSSLARHTSILPPRASFTGQQILKALQNQGIMLTKVIECNAFASLKTLLLAGLGWGILPSGLLDAGKPRLTIVQVQPEFTVKRQLGFAQHKNRLASPAVQAFIQLALQLYKEPRKS